MDDKDIQNTIGMIFESLISARNTEIQDVYGELLDKMSTNLPLDNANEFSALVTHPINEILSHLIMSVNPNLPSEERADDLQFLYLQYDFLKYHLDRIMVQKEGSPCSSDKVYWLLYVYKLYLSTETVPDMTIDKKTYWKPHFGTGKQWMSFIESLEGLYYGKPEKYLINYHELLWGISDEEGSGT